MVQAMRKIVMLLNLVLFLFSKQLFSQNRQDEIIATWQTQEAQVEIYQLNKQYIGNPINTRGERNTEIEILNLVYEKDKWIGKIYSRKRDKTFDVECEVKGDTLLLKVRAGFATRNLEWNKAE